MKTKPKGRPISLAMKSLIITMKILILLFSVVSFGFNMEKGFSQNSKIIFNSDAELSVEDVFEVVKKQTEHTFIYKSDLFVNAPKIIVDKGAITLRDLLTKCRSVAHFEFQFSKKGAILLREKPEIIQAKPLQQSVDGTVTDSNGTPLPGANIIEKGTTNGVTADFDGNFSLNVTDGNTTLVVSYIGFATKEVVVNGQTYINIVLEESAAGLDEVVVVGYGTVKKSDLTGSVSSVSGDDLTAVPTTTFSQALQGRAAGVQITQTSGVPGGETNIRIRGTNSINASSEPLYVIDGMLVNSDGGETTIGGRGPRISPLASINPNDIESIEILKDASAASIYGSRGANGVVLITTKSGKEGKGTISFNTYYGVQKVGKQLNLLNASQFAELVNEAEINAGEAIVYPDASALGKGTDWQEELFRLASIADYNLSFRGGNENINYALSGGYFTQEGIIIGSDFERYSFRVNLNSKVSEKITIGNNLSYSRTTADGVLTGPGNIVPGVVTNALQINPILNVYDPNQPGGYTFEHDRKDAIANPIAEALEYESNTVTSRLLGNVFVTYDLMDALTFKTSLGIDALTTKSNSFGPNFLKRTESSMGEASVNDLNALTWLNENTLTYDKALGETSNLNVLLGLTFQKFKNETLGTFVFDFPDGRTGYHNLEAGQNPQNTSNSESAWSLISYLGRINYSLLDKYLFTASGRIDGSSKFSEGNKYGFFPSGAFAWKISNEAFMENIEEISNLKLRLSYGVLGNQGIGPYNSLALVSPYGEGVFSTGIGEPDVFFGSEPRSYPNTNLKWETTNQANLGIDLGLWENRLSLTAEVYSKKTSDLLLQTPIAYTNGFGSTLLNVGNVSNKGFGIEISSRNLSGGVSWTTSGNFSVNRNEITNLARDEDINLTAGSLLRKGEPIGTFYGYQFAGIFQTDAEAANSAVQRGETAQAGNIKYNDLSGPDGAPDGVIDEFDRAILGDAEPDFTWGLTNDFAYKNFSLSVFFQGSQGNDMVNLNLSHLENLNGEQNVLSDAGLNRWTPTNPSNEYPRAAADYLYYQTYSSRFIEDASYVRLKNVTLGYNLPRTVLDRINMQSMRFYISGTNLLTFTNYNGYDPEGNAYGSSTNLVGIDSGNYPQTKIVTFGVNLGF